MKDMTYYQFIYGCLEKIKQNIKHNELNSEFLGDLNNSMDETVRRFEETQTGSHWHRLLSFGDPRIDNEHMMDELG